MSPALPETRFSAWISGGSVAFLQSQIMSIVFRGYWNKVSPDKAVLWRGLCFCGVLDDNTILRKSFLSVLAFSRPAPPEEKWSRWPCFAFSPQFPFYLFRPVRRLSLYWVKCGAMLSDLMAWWSGGNNGMEHYQCGKRCYIRSCGEPWCERDERQNTREEEGMWRGSGLVRHRHQRY